MLLHIERHYYHQVMKKYLKDCYLALQSKATSSATDSACVQLFGYSYAGMGALFLINISISSLQKYCYYMAIFHRITKEFKARNCYCFCIYYLRVVDF